MSGLNLEPCSSYSIRERFGCAKCQTNPEIVQAKSDSGMITVTLRCHGETITKSYPKSDLIFPQILWEENG